MLAKHCGNLIRVLGVACLLCAATLTFVSCATQPAREPGPYLATSHPPVLEDTETLILLDQSLRSSISVEGQRASYTPDSRLVAEAKIRNLVERAQEIQVQTVFKDNAGMSSGDETAWQTLILNPNAMETYRATALNDHSTKYTIRIRVAR